MTSTRPYLRKKAVLIMYKVFLKFPDALRPAFPRLKEKLEDPDPGLIVLCSLLLWISVLCFTNYTVYQRWYVIYMAAEPVL